MTFKILIQREAAEALRDFDRKTRRRIKDSENALRDGPFQEISGADIRKLVDTRVWELLQTPAKTV